MMVDPLPTRAELKLILSRLTAFSSNKPSRWGGDRIARLDRVKLLALWERRVAENPRYRSLANQLLQPIRRKLGTDDPATQSRRASETISKRFMETLRKAKEYPAPKPMPTAPQMAKKLAHAVTDWAASGFKMAPTDLVSSRLATCNGCEFWDAMAFAGTGRCKKCGCATQAKIRLATERCPVGRW